MLIQLTSVKQRYLLVLKRQKDTIENVEFIRIISYKTSLLGAKIEFKINIFKFNIKSYAIALYELSKNNSELDKD